MLTINNFFDTEGSTTYVINILLDAIDRLKKNNVNVESFSFNVYNVSINIELKEVTINEDIFFDNNELLKIPLDDFYNRLMQIREKYE